MKFPNQQDNILTSISKLKMKLKSDKFELECIKNDFGKARVCSTKIDISNKIQQQKQNQEFRGNTRLKEDLTILNLNSQMTELVKSHKIQIKNIIQKYQKLLNQRNQLIEMQVTEIKQLKASYQLRLEQKNVYIDMLKQTIALNKEQQTNNNSIEQLKKYYQSEISKTKQKYEKIITNLQDCLKEKTCKEYNNNSSLKNIDQLNQSQISIRRLNYSERERTRNINQSQNFQDDSDIFYSNNNTARQSLIMQANNKPQLFTKKNTNKKFSNLFKDKLKFKKQSTNDIVNNEIPQSHSSMMKESFGQNKIIYKSSVNLCQQYLTAAQGKKSNILEYKNKDGKKIN